MNVVVQRRVVIAVVCAGLLMQSVVWRLIGEPYPGVFMPGFGGAMESPEGGVEFNDVDVIVTFADGDRVVTDRQELLAEAKASQRTFIMRWVFSARADPAPPPPDPPWKAWVKRHVFPYRIDHNRRWFENHTHPETKHWLRRRVAELWPDRPAAESVTFRWVEVHVDFASGERRRVHDYDYRIRLDATAK